MFEINERNHGQNFFGGEYFSIPNIMQDILEWPDWQCYICCYFTGR